jgi:hypothetical protein
VSWLRRRQAVRAERERAAQQQAEAAWMGFWKAMHEAMTVREQRGEQDRG